MTEFQKQINLIIEKHGQRADVYIKRWKNGTLSLRELAVALDRLADFQADDINDLYATTKKSGNAFPPQTA